MKRFIAPLLALSVIAVAAPAMAAPWQSVNDRQSNLDNRIDMGVRNGSLTRAEGARLHGEFRQITRLEQRYRRDGLSGRERADLDRRFDRLSAQIRYERHDNDHYGQGYGRGR